MDEQPAAHVLTDPEERLRTLLEIGQVLVSNVTRDALFGAIAAALRRVVPFDRAAIFVHDPARDVVRLFLLESALPSTYFAPGFEMPVDGSHVGDVVRHGRPRLVRDLAAERSYPAEESAYADGVRAYAIVPLLLRGTPVGGLAVASTTPGRYAPADVAFLEEVGRQVAMALDNLKSYGEIAGLNERLAFTASRLRTLLEINNAVVANLSRDGLLQAVGRALRPALAFDRGAVFLHDRERDVLRLYAFASGRPSARFVLGTEVPVAGSHVGWVLVHRQARARRDLAAEPREFPQEDWALADGTRAYVAVPLATQGRAIGVLVIASPTPGQYSGADVEFLQEVAGQVALAVQNMTSYEEVAALKARLEHENVYLQEELQREHADVVGSSPTLLALLRRIEMVAGTDATVLVTGETGTGKELVARAIHRASPRRDRPLVKVNCCAISAGLVESELFGHVKGAFTGALERRVGRFQLADGGTILLDEVGELPPETQVKLLRVLQEREFEPVGSDRTIRVDVRVIAATNRDLQEAVRAGRFRADLFYRLNVFPVEVPPLRDRPGDVPQLVMYFLSHYAARFGRRVHAVSDEAMARLRAYPWPGNVRELQNVIERAVVLSPGEWLELDHELADVPAAPGAAAPAGLGIEDLDATLQETERRCIREALARSGGVIEGPRGAARLLKLHPNTLRSRMEKLGIRRHDFS